MSRFVPPDTYYPPSRQWLDQRIALNQELVSPAILLAEVSGAIARRTGDSMVASQVVDMIVRLPNVKLVYIDAGLAALSAQVAANLRLRGADSFYVALAYQLSMPLVTWDQEQRERGRSLISSLTPRES